MKQNIVTSLKLFLLTSLLMLSSMTLTSQTFGQQVPSLIPGKKAPITAADFPSIAQPKMKWAPDNFAKDPSVVRFKDRYFMYFSFPPQQVKGKKFGWTTGVAESTDLTNWKLAGSILPMQECDQKGLCAPCAKVINGKVWIFYQTYGTGAKDAICAAWSEDGVHFTPHPKNPIFRPHGDWTNGRAIDADVIEFKGKMFLYSATRDPKGQIQKVTVATAQPGTDLGPDQWTQAADRSILYPQLDWETKCIEAPTAIEKDGKLYMFYAGGYNNNPQQIGVAVSENGIDYTRLWDVPFIPFGPEGQWNHSETGHPGVFQDENGQTWLFFQGNNTHGKDWYLSRVKIDWKRDEKSGLLVPFVAEENK